MATPNLNTKPIYIPASGSVDVGMSGRFIKCLTSSGSAGDILVSIGGGAESIFDVLVKYKFDPGNGFNGFTLRNTTGVAVTMRVYVGDGDIDTGNDVTISGTVATLETKAATIADTSDVTLNNGAETALLVALATRRTAVIVADPANTANIRVGKTGTVSATRGAMLQPGQMMSLDTKSAIYGFAAAAGQKVSLLEIAD